MFGTFELAIYERGEASQTIFWKYRDSFPAEVALIMNTIDFNH
jgi:hypothetical protein